MTRYLPEMTPPASTVLAADHVDPEQTFRRVLIQLCFVVENMHEALPYFTGAFGAGPWFVADASSYPDTTYRGEPAPLRARIALAYSGDMMFELVCPEPGSHSIFTEWAGARGYGLHHLGFAVDDYDTAVSAMLAAGREQLSTTTTPRGARLVIVGGSDLLNVLEEYIELTPASERFYAFMKTRAAQWDHTELVYAGPPPAL